jgi:hypothetical protein
MRKSKQTSAGDTGTQGTCNLVSLFYILTDEASFSCSSPHSPICVACVQLPSSNLPLPSAHPPLASLIQPPFSDQQSLPLAAPSNSPSPASSSLPSPTHRQAHHPAPFPHPNASFTRTRLLAPSHSCIQTHLPSRNASSLAYAQLLNTICRIQPQYCAPGTKYVCFIYQLVEFSVILASSSCALSLPSLGW